ncbi:MAG: cobalt ECF transporter T component CbiQ [Spirochaetota bacterium]|nr:cobalt ECF transporter T component CbiQ [Spirochaetota bacterium]
MHIDIDRFSNINSQFHKWDERYKIISILILIISFSVVKSFYLVLTIPILALIMVTISRLPLYFVLKKLKLTLIFFLPLFILLPISSGGEIFYLIVGIKIYKIGLHLAISIFLKAISILICIMIMFGTSRFDRTIKAFYHLKIPEKLIIMILFTYRYIYIYMENLRKLNVALFLQGFKKTSNLRSILVSSSLIGNLLIRCYDQTEMVYNAMILRGFNGKLISQFRFKASKTDLFKAIIIIFISLLIVGLEIII